MRLKRKHWKAPSMTACKGEIWLANLNPQKKPNEVGKMRPVLVIQNDILNRSAYPNTIVIPLSTRLVDDAEPLRFRISARKKLEKDSDALIGHIRSIDNDRFVEKLAEVTEEELKTVLKLLIEILE